MANVAVQQDNFNDALPAAPTGQMNAKWQADTPPIAVRNISANVRNHGGVDARSTTTETIGLAAQGKIVTLNAAGAVAVTLDSTVPATFMAYVSSEGSGGATLTPSSGLIDNAANLALLTLQGVALFFDGTNWWTERGMGAGGSTGVLLKTTNYTTSAADNGKLISFNLAANATLTLPSSPPPGTWSIEVENTQDAGLLFVNPNGLQLDESTAQVPIPAPHGMRIFSDGSNYYTERGMPDDLAQPCSITVSGSDLFSSSAFALIASFQTTTPAANLGFRQAVGAATMQARGGLSVVMNCLAGSTIVVIAEIVSAFLPFAGVQDSQGNTYNQILLSVGGSYGYLMFYAANVSAGANTVEVILSVNALTTPMGDVGAATIGSSAGTGFHVGDYLQVNGGGGTGAILKVASLSGSAIATFSVVSGGVGYAATTNAALAVLTGTGSGSPTANITLAAFPYAAAPGIAVPSITGITFPKGGLASSNTAPFEYFVSTVNGNTALLGVPPNWIPWSGVAMIALEYQGAGSGVSVLGSASGTAPGLPVTAGPVTCPTPGTGWSVGAGLNPNRGDPAFPEVYSASPGWQKRITVAQANISPFFGGGGGFSMAAFDGFGCCSPGFYQNVSNGGGGAMTQQPKLNFIIPIVAVDDPANTSTDVQLELGGVSARTTTAETIHKSDYGFLVTLSNASPIACTLDSTVPNWFYCAVQVDGAGTVTFTPSTGNINGSATATLSGSHAGGWLFFDGTNWWFISTSGGGTTFYQTVQQAGSAKPQETILNFLAPITATDNPGNTSTDIAVPVFIASGASHAKGLVPDPGSSAGTTKFLREDASFAVPPGTLPDPVTVAHGGTGDTSLTAHGVLVGEGTSAVAVTAAGAAGSFLGGNGTADPAFTNAIGNVDARTTTSETITTASRGNLVTFSNASPTIATLDSTVAAYFQCAVEDIGTGITTLTPSTGTINGAASFVLNKNEGGWLFFNGTNWWFVGGAAGAISSLTEKFIIGDATVPAALPNTKSWPGLYNSPDIPPVSPTAFDYEFDDNSFFLDPTHTTYGIWTLLNGDSGHASPTARASKSWMSMWQRGEGSASHLRGFYQAAPTSTTWEFTVKLGCNLLANDSGSLIAEFGLLLFESGTNKAVTFGVTISNLSVIGQFLDLLNWTNLTTVARIDNTSPTYPMSGMPLYLRVQKTSTQLAFSYSYAGADPGGGVNNLSASVGSSDFLQPFASLTLTTYFTTKPDSIGFGGNAFSGSVVLLADWIRKTA